MKDKIIQVKMWAEAEDDSVVVEFFRGDRKSRAYHVRGLLESERHVQEISSQLYDVWENNRPSVIIRPFMGGGVGYVLEVKR